MQTLEGAARGMTLAYIPKPRSLRRGLSDPKSASEQTKERRRGGWALAGRVRVLGHALPGPGEPGPGLSDCGGGGEGGRDPGEAGGQRRPDPAPIPAVPAPPGAAAARLCPPLPRSLFLFCHLPVAKHCWEPHVGDAAALSPAQEAAAAAAQGLGRSTRPPVRLPGAGRSRGRSGRGAQLLPQPCPRIPGVRPGSEPAPGGVPGEGRGPQPSQCGHRNKEGSANFTPESRQLQRRKVRQLAMLVAWGGDAGTFRSRTGWGGDRGGTSASLEGSLAGAWAHLSLPRPRGALAGTAAGALRPHARRVPSPASPRPQRHGAQGTRGLSPTPALSQMQPQDPGAPAVPRLAGRERA